MVKGRTTIKNSIMNWEVTETLIRITINLPKDYPKTPLWRVLTDYRDSQIGYLLASIKNDRLIFLHALYVYPNLYKDILVPSEKKYFKGLGKAMLCLFVDLAVKSGHFVDDLSEIKVCLEASGGECETDIYHNFYRSFPMTELKQIILLEYPEATFDKGVTKEDLIKTICSAEANKSLIRYYKSLGFVIDSHTDPYYSEMSGYLSDILQKCGS